jgi:hypothetical protein
MVQDIVRCLRAARPIPVPRPSTRKRSARIISRAEARINTTRVQIRRIAGPTDRVLILERPGAGVNVRHRERTPHLFVFGLVLGQWSA